MYKILAFISLLVNTLSRLQAWPVSHIVLFSTKLECEGSNVNFTSFSIKNEVCMCNISMERKLGRLPDDIKNDKLAY